MIPPEDLKAADDFLRQQEEAGGTVANSSVVGDPYQVPGHLEAGCPCIVCQTRAALKKSAHPPGEIKVDYRHSPLDPDSACVDQVLATIKERGKIYGDPALSHHNIGLTWTGLIQQHYGIRLDHPLPAWLVELMMVAFKVHRSARVFHADNYVDAKAYLKFAEEDQEKGVV
jgi:hypothetical protein